MADLGDRQDSTGAGQNLARVRVRRYDPAQGGEAFYQEYTGVPFENRSVLDVLRSIFLIQDPSLAYSHVCTTGYCGSCMLVVNGTPVLACQFPAQPEMTIEPHPKFPVVRDLVVRLEPERAGARQPAGTGFSPAGQKSQGAVRVSGRQVTEIDPERCVHCQDCVGVCPVGVYRFVDKRVQVADPDSCLGPSCNMCVDTCWKMAIRMTRLQ